MKRGSRLHLGWRDVFFMLELSFFLFQDDADAVDNETMKQRNDEEEVGDEREDNGEVRVVRVALQPFDGIKNVVCPRGGGAIVYL